MRVLFVALLAACAAPDPHEPATCDGTSWSAVFNPPPASCERACVEVPANFGGTASDMPCMLTATNPNHPGAVGSCMRTFVDADSGARGCCIVDSIAQVAHAEFWQCQ